MPSKNDKVIEAKDEAENKVVKEYYDILIPSDPNNKEITHMTYMHNGVGYMFPYDKVIRVSKVIRDDLLLKGVIINIQ